MVTDSTLDYSRADRPQASGSGLCGARPRALAIAVALALGAGPVGAATFTVTSAADAGAGTLREAITAANQNPGPDIIEFAPGLGDIVLQSEIAISDPLDIVGPVGQQVIRGSGSGRLLAVRNSDAVVTLENLFLADGRSIGPGGGACESYAIPRGAIASYGDGGAVCTIADITLVGTTITGSSVSGDSISGGGLFSSGSVTVVGSTVSDNTTDGDFSRGGGIFAGGGLVMDDSVVSGNSTAGGNAGGGGIWFGDDAQIRNSVISGNATTGDFADGGGLSGSGTLVIGDSSVVGNSTSGAGAQGGGMRLSSTSQIVNSTISGNSTAAVDAPGGGVYVLGTNLAVSNSTVTGNTSQAGAGGIEARAQEGLAYFIQFESAIIAGNTGPDGNFLARPGSGTIVVDSGASLFGDSQAEITGASTGNVFSNTTGLEALGDNGCATPAGAAPSAQCAPTHLPGPGSAAIDRGSNSLSLEFDQRGEGFPRTRNAVTDIGALESDLPPAPPVPADLRVKKSDGDIVTGPGEILTWRIEYANVGELAAQGVVLAETVPDSTTFNESMAGEWVCEADGGSGSRCLFEIGELPPGAAGTVAFSVTVDDPSEAVEIVNTVEISGTDSDTTDPNPANNIAVETTPLSGPGRLTVPGRGSLPVPGFIVGFGDPDGTRVAPRLGATAAAIGDLDGDGRADVAVSAPDGDAVLLVQGRPLDGDALALSTFPSQAFPGFLIQAEDGFGGLGDRMAGIGDVNGDGLGGLVYSDGTIELNVLTGRQRGAYVQPGFEAPPPFVVDQGGVFSPQDGLELTSLQASGPFATSLAGLGDVDADGLDDLALVTSFGVPPFRLETIFVLFGDPDFAAFEAGSAVVEDASSANGLRLTNGASSQSRFGASIARLGDFNGDGVDDFAIGAPRQDSGAVFVIFGSPEIAESSEGLIDTASLDGINGFAVLGADDGARFGAQIAGAGDFDGDGLADIVIGEQASAGEPGRVHVVFGTAAGLPPEVSLDDAGALRSTRIRGVAANDDFGLAVAGLGDIDGDGRDDLALGAPGLAEAFEGQPPAADTGRVFVLFGSADPPAEFAVAALDAAQGYWLTAPSPGIRFGAALAGPGDFDGDGLPDLLVTAPETPFEAVPGAGQFWILSGALRPDPQGFAVEIQEFGVTPEVVFPGDIAQIRWAAVPDDDSTVCAGSGLPGTSWQGAGKPASGTRQVDTAPLAPGLYFPTLTCQRNGETAEFEAVLEVLEPPPEIQQFSVTPETVFAGDIAQISWVAVPDDNSTVCAGSGLPGTSWQGSGKPASGTREVDTAPLAPGLYFPTLTCQRNGESAEVEAALEVLEPPPEIQQFSVTPGSIFVGNVVEISWAATPDDAATACAGSGLPGTSWNTTGLPASGTRQVETSPLSPGSYLLTLTCERGGAVVEAQATLEVLEPPASLSLAGNRTGLQFFGDRFVRVELTNDSSVSAESVVLDLLAPAGYQAIGVFRLAGSCTADDAGDFSCDAESIPAWQCGAAPGGFACELEALPAAATAAIVLQLRGEGPGQLEAAANAVNALPTALDIPVQD